VSSDDRTPVTTRVPAYQKEVWEDDADELGMSQSEFVRTMVQAGRHELGLATESAAGSDRAAGKTSVGSSAAAEGAAAERAAAESAVAAEETDSETSVDWSPADSAVSENGVEPDPPAATPGGEPLEDRVLAILREREVCSWDELLEAVVSDFEDQLDETMGELIESGPVTYSGRAGGYVLDE
jgi:hypothetical protein